MMNRIGTKEFDIWQKIATAMMVWTLEIMDRLELPVHLNIEKMCFRFGRVALIRDGEITVAGTAELQELSTNVELCYHHICAYLGDPLRRGHPAYVADLVDIEPHLALAIVGLDLIDTVLIGPAHRAADMIASDPRLHTAARSRVTWCDCEDAWGQAMSTILARADALLAQAAIEELLRNA